MNPIKLFVWKQTTTFEKSKNEQEEKYGWF